MDVKESYRILELKPGADLDEIKAAYRRMAFKLHPDLNHDNPQAAADFQRLNEAYVILKQAVGDESRFEGPKSRRAKQEKQRASARPAGPSQPPPWREKAQPGPGATPGAGAKAKARAAGQASGGPGAQRAAGSGAQASAGARAQTGPGAATGASSSAKAGAGPGATKAKPKRDVIRNIMNDPFARKVFEEIYSHIKSGEAKPKGTVKKREVSLKWGEKQMTMDLSRGLFSGVKGWFKRQFDDEQVVYLSPSQLMPGTRLKIQIRRAWSGKPASVELPLPHDYVVGRPLRLKGLGRQFGPFKGDLYLRLLAK